MGTRSRIAVKADDDSYQSIYCHWDGYPDHVGATLAEHYDAAKAQALIALGNISSLGAEIGAAHNFNGPHEGVCNAYGRDRGEAGQEAVASPDLAALSKLTQDTGGEWLYVFDGEQWLCAEGGMSMFGHPASHEPGELKPVSEWLKASEEDQDD